nr:DUF3574 domain-containing protein [Betaproteobacteria bacterium]
MTINTFAIKSWKWFLGRVALALVLSATAILAMSPSEAFAEMKGLYETRLFFGRDVAPDKLCGMDYVTNEQWSYFVKTEVYKKGGKGFSGFTVIDSHGYWEG